MSEPETATVVTAPVTPAVAEGTRQTIESASARVLEQFRALSTGVADEPVSATVTAEPTGLKELTRISRQKRELAAQLKAQDAQLAEIAPVREIQKLYKEGKYAEAIALLSGKADSTDALDDLITNHFSKVLDDGSTTPVVIPEEVRTKLTELETKLTDREKADKDRIEAEQVANLNLFIKNAVFEPNSEKLELCMRPENKEESFLLANKMLNDLIKDNPEIDYSTPEATAALYLTIFETIEEQYEETGRKRYVKSGNTLLSRPVTTTVPQHTSPETARSSSTINLPKPAIRPELPKKHESIEEVMARTKRAYLDSLR